MSTIPVLDGPRLAPASGGAAKSLVIFVHGYGSNGEDLIGLAPYWQDALPDTTFSYFTLREQAGKLWKVLSAMGTCKQS